MTMNRRSILQAMLSSVAVGLSLTPHQIQAHIATTERQMEELIPAFCMIRQIAAHDGQRSALIANFEALRPAISHMGSFTMFEDVADANSMWILDFWRSREDYDSAWKQGDLQPLLAQQRALISHVQSRAEMKIPTSTSL